MDYAENKLGIHDLSKTVEYGLKVFSIKIVEIKSCLIPFIGIVTFDVLVCLRTRHGITYFRRI